MKSTSTLALLMAAGLAMGVAPASAADLGGNCCADLEERVAELEATTVRKGNRKVSLTLSGQVNRTIMMWDDGFNRNTYYGIDNTNSSTRFSLQGSAKINAEWSAGFSIVIDVADKARTFSVSNNGGAEDGSAAFGGANGDYALRMRDANWWIQSDRIGRVTVGRLTTSGAVAGIDLAGIQVVAGSSPGCAGGGLLWRTTNAANLGNAIYNMNTSTDGCAYPTTRGEGVKWTSPTWQGFVVSASVAEASSTDAYQVFQAAGPQLSSTGNNVGIDLKYAGEFNGVRVAFGLGWERFQGNGDGVLNAPASNAGDLTDLETSNFGLAGSLMHVPTGLFVNADWLRSTNNRPASAGLVNPYLGEREATRWNIQAGVSRNWFGIGNTVLYGEFGRANDWLFARGNIVSATNNGNFAVNVGGDSTRWWGLGIVQNIDAAAMELYLGYRNFSHNNSAAFPLDPVADIDVVLAGARIKF